MKLEPVKLLVWTELTVVIGIRKCGNFMKSCLREIQTQSGFIHRFVTYANDWTGP